MKGRHLKSLILKIDLLPTMILFCRGRPFLVNRPPMTTPPKNSEIFAKSPLFKFIYGNLAKISEFLEEGSKKYILKTFFRNFVPHDRELYALDWFPTLCAGFRRIYPQNPGCQKCVISKKSEILAKFLTTFT